MGLTLPIARTWRRCCATRISKASSATPWRSMSCSPTPTSATPAVLLDEVARNCALARLSEVDDIHLASMTTPGAIVIPAALTMARSWPEADASDLAAAILAGYEAMVRLGLAIDGPAILYRGI